MDKETSSKSKKDETTSVDSPPVNSDLLVGSIIIILIVLFSIFAGGYLIKSYFQKPSSEISEGLPITTNIEGNITGDSNFSQNNFNDVPPVYTGDNNNSNDNNNTNNNNTNNNSDQNTTNDEDDDSGSSDGGGGGGGGTTPPTPTDACANLGEVTFSPAAGTFNESLYLILSYTGNSQCTTKTIHYTTNNTDPTLASTTYNNPIHLSSTTTIKAAVFATTQSNQQVHGEIISQTYNILVPENVVDAPYPDHDTGIYYNDIYVTLSTDTPETLIRYTLDGSNPSYSSSIYSTPILVSTTQTIKAKANYIGLNDSEIMIKTYTMNVSNPTTSTPSGTAVSSGAVITLYTATTGGSYIRYKTDGQSPGCDNGTLGNSITITGATTIKAIACKDGYNSSGVVTFSYTILPPNTVATPTASPPSGPYTTAQNVTLTCETADSTIKYTLDGSDPSTSSTAITYINPINISSTKTIKARGFKSGWTQSELFTGTYTITGTVSTPVIGPDPDPSNYNKVITITSQSGATIRYTLDGSEPTTSSAQYPTAGITLNQTTDVTVKAKAYLSNWNPSATASKIYPISKVTTPTANPYGGTYTTASVQLSVSNPSDATIRYTTDGTTPTCSTETAYSSAIDISSNTTLKAIGCKTGYVPSNVMTETYTINPQQSGWLWAKRFGGTDIDEISNMVVDSSGNTYITGIYKGAMQIGSFTLPNRSTSDYDVFVAKIDPVGNVLWAARAGGTYYDVGNDIAVDSSGNVYVTGTFNSNIIYFGNNNDLNLARNFTSNDVFIAKLNSSGQWQWAKRAGGTYSDSGKAIVVDSQSNIYVTGEFQGAQPVGSYGTLPPFGGYGYSDIFVTKLNSDGVFLWVTKAGGTNSENVKTIALDSQNNIYIGGSFASDNLDFNGTLDLNNSVTNNTLDAFIAKLDNSGNWLWARKSDGTGSDSLYDLTISNNNLYITGYKQSGAQFGDFTSPTYGEFDIYVAKMDLTGNWLWVNSGGSPHYDFGWGIAANSSNVYVTGEFKGTATFGDITLTNPSTTNFDIFTSVLDSSTGNWTSAESFGTSSNNDLGQSVAVDGSGNTYWTGNFTGSIVFGNTTTLDSNNTSQDIYIAKKG